MPETFHVGLGNRIDTQQFVGPSREQFGQYFVRSLARLTNAPIYGHNLRQGTGCTQRVRRSVLAVACFSYGRFLLA